MARQRLTRKMVSEEFAMLRACVTDYFGMRWPELEEAYYSHFPAAKEHANVKDMSREYVIRQLIMSSIYHAMNCLDIEKEQVMSKKPKPVFDDAAFIRKYNDWPCWPFCPLKRRSNSLEKKDLGVLLATQEHADAVVKKPGSKFIIYHGYMFDFPKTGEEVSKLPTTEYASLEELLADGWVVD